MGRSRQIMMSIVITGLAFFATLTATLAAPVQIGEQHYCTKHFTCCAQWDFFIPVMVACVENEPSIGILKTEKDNCARVQRSKVPIWTRVETPEWRCYGVCNGSTPIITRKTIEADEK